MWEWFRDWILIAVIWLQNSPVIQGVIFSVLCAWLRVLMDEHETKIRQAVGEGLMCAFLTIAACGCQWLFDWPSSFAIVIGVVIGFIGSKKIDKLISKWGEKKAEGAL